MTERQILGGVLGVLLALAASSLLAAGYSVRQLDERVLSADDLHVDALSSAHALNANVNESAQETFAYLVAGDAGEKIDALAAIEEFDSLLADFEAADAHDHAAVDSLASITRAHDSYATLSGEVLADFEENGATDPARFEELEAAIDQLTDEIQLLIVPEEVEALAAEQVAVHIERRALDTIGRLGLVIAGLALAGAGFTWFLYRHLSKARRVAEFDLGLHMQALEASSVGVLMVSAVEKDEPVIYANPAFERVTGYSRDQVLGRNCRFLQGPGTDQAVVAEIRAAVAAGEPIDVTVENYTVDGTSFWNDLHIAPVRNTSGDVTHFVGVMNDVTDRVRMESRLLQAAKMEAVGHLAGGIAHDFNNYLMVISAAISVMEREDEPDTSFWLKQIADASSRSAALSQQLMTFARAQVAEPELLNLDDVIEALKPLLALIIDENVSMSVESEGRHPCLVLADRSQLEQVVTNVVINARDAMPHGGRLTIGTWVETLGSADVAGHAGAVPGPFVVLAISDSGEGIDDAVIDSIFEPFVTTKPSEAGAGLGLATVYGIVTRAGGLVQIDSQPGRGTTFRIFFPAAAGEERAPVVASDMDTKFDAPGTVLLVEDDQIVRSAMATMLCSLDFDLIEAENGQQGLELLVDHPEIALLVSDVTMPEMGGIDLAERATELRPDLKVLLVSGYIENGADSPRLTDMFLTKPFSLDQLRMKIAELLAADRLHESIT